MSKLQPRRPAQPNPQRMSRQPSPPPPPPPPRRTAPRPATVPQSNEPNWLPLCALIGTLAVMAVVCILVLIVAIRSARSGTSASVSSPEVVNERPPEGPRAEEQPAVEPPPTKSPPVVRAEEPVRADAEVNDPWEPELEPGVPTVRTEQEVEVDATGDARFTAVIVLPPERHRAFKRLVSRPYVEGGELKWREPRITSVLRGLDLESAGSIMEDLGGSFEEDAIRVRGREIGWARQRDGNWVNPLTTDRKNVYRITRKTYQDGIPIVTLRVKIASGGAQIVSRLQVTLPRGAHDIRVENEPNELVYQAPAPTGGSPGRKPAFRLQTKPHVMSALYKLYGDRRFHKLWVARAVFRNAGSERLTDYKVRFRLAGYSEWSRWERCDAVYPGQTVVDPFYPAIDSRIRELHAATPVDVQVEYSYVRADGKTIEDSYSERTRLLGMNEGVYSDVEVDKDSSWYEMFKDAPLVLASFTSANDPVILDVVGMLSQATGGVGPSLSDRHAMTFLRALYDLMRANIKYETTPGDRIDGLLHQHLKYGRDVLRTKSGTCVNTAIFYASVAEAAGLDAYIFVIKGHAFAGVRLPKNGGLVLVETTLATGRGADFTEAVESATKTYAAAAELGLLLPVDIRQQRRRGVTPPELPDAGKNPLKEWGIRPPTASAAPHPSRTALVRASESGR